MQGVRSSRTIKGQGATTPDDVIEAITDLTHRTRGPAEIAKLLSEDGEYRHLRGRIPKLRTIKKYAALAKKGLPGASVPWRFTDAPADEVPLVMPVVAAVIEKSAGRVREISKAEAALVARIVRAAPDVPPWTAYRLARRILADPDAAGDVQIELALKPWTQRYETPEEAMREHRSEGEAP